MSESAWIGLGVAVARSDILEEATEVFVESLRYLPESPQLLYNLGLTLALRGETVAAVGAFESALELSPEHLAARENLAGVLAATGRFEEAVEQYRKNKFPVTVKELPGAGRPLNTEERAELARWIDTLDRI